MADSMRDVFDAVWNQAITINQLEVVLRIVRESEFRWHPLGFMHTRLDLWEPNVLRFHIWPKGLRRPQEPPWFVHNHNFDFCSYVMCGNLRNNLFEVADAKGNDSSVLYEIEYDGSDSVMNRTDIRVTVKPKGSEDMTALNYYREACSDFHATDVSLAETTATLVAARVVSKEMPYVVGDAKGDAIYRFGRRLCKPEEVTAALRTIEMQSRT